ncbi:MULTISPECIES: hypothetical protein [unclassified Candidatus Tisiphia]|uniref:hypothetical protein n=1 Tax=unclassified Candidatus Tisiphia TaxID=2996318 RepID=UPI003CCAA5B0
MTAPNIPNTPRILRTEERIEAAEPAVVVRDSTFGESLTVRAGGHTIYFRGHDFHITDFSFAPNGHANLYYNGSHYSINVLGDMYVTFIGNGIEFTDAA